jgi:hypothetical protein
MALTATLVRTRLRFLTLPLILIAVLVSPLSPSVSAQEVETEERGADSGYVSGYRPQFYIRSMDDKLSGSTPNAELDIAPDSRGLIRRP